MAKADVFLQDVYLCFGKMRKQVISFPQFFLKLFKDAPVSKYNFGPNFADADPLTDLYRQYDAVRQAWAVPAGKQGALYW